MSWNFVNMVGEIFGNLEVIGPHENRKGGTYWKVKCSCGEELFIARSSLVGGKSKSCGCKRGIGPGKKGPSCNQAKSALKNMKTRCYNENSTDYGYYGARGITICDKWLNDSEAFYRWFDDNWDFDLVIDRLDNDKGYSPENCAFVTPSESARNRRPWNKNDSVKVT